MLQRCQLNVALSSKKAMTCQKKLTIAIFARPKNVYESFTTQSIPHNTIMLSPKVIETSHQLNACRHRSEQWERSRQKDQRV